MGERVMESKLLKFPLIENAVIRADLLYTNSTLKHFSFIVFSFHLFFSCAAHSDCSLPSPPLLSALPSFLLPSPPLDPWSAALLFSVTKYQVSQGYMA